MPSQYIRIEEAAARANVHERTIRMFVRQGKLTVYQRHGSRALLFDPDEIDSLVAVRRIKRPSFEAVEAEARRIATLAPPLTPEQRERIASILLSGNGIREGAA